MKAKLSLFSLLLAMSLTPAFAGWQYGGYYIDDSYYEDDGTKFVIGFRGGMSWANAKIKNEIGNLDGIYYMDDSGNVISQRAYEAYLSDLEPGDPDPFVYAGAGDLSSLPAKENFSKFAYTAGASIGFTVPYHPNWRLEANYDHISETNYNQIPLFSGDLRVSGGALGDNGLVHVSSGGASATISTDIISAMAYYDFFEGDAKPLNKIIPYFGLGIGYASSKTTLRLSDIYGDLSTDSDLQNYGEADSAGVVHFTPPSDKSKYPSSENVAAVGALGFSYGLTKYTFLDFGARLMYVPKITWNLVNSDASQHREWFSAKNMIYTNLTLGLRFEF